MSELLRQTLREHLDWSPEGDDRLRFMALALCGEAGELANLVKKDWRGDEGGEARRAKMISELADVAAHAGMIAELLDVDLEEEILRKARVVEGRPAWREWVSTRWDVRSGPTHRWIHEAWFADRRGAMVFASERVAAAGHGRVFERLGENRVVYYEIF